MIKMSADLPYFPLFPSDWVLETKSLTLYEQGALLQLVCAMHESPVRGYLLFNGVPMPPDRIARILGIDRQPALGVLDRLLESGVLKKDLDLGAVFYPPMVKREELRKTRQKSGKKGGLSNKPPDFAQAKSKENPEQIPKQTLEYGNGIGVPPSDGVSKGGNPTLSEVLTECSMRGIPSLCGESFFNMEEGCGWLDSRGRQIVDWRPVLRNYATTWRANEQKQKSYGNPHQRPTQPNPRNIGLSGDAAERTRRIVERVAQQQKELTSGSPPSH